MAVTIAIDGPVGSGKSSVSRRLAQTLGILHLDSGAMYRALGLKAVRQGIDPRDQAASEALCKETNISVTLEGDQQHTFLDGEDVTGLIRTPEVSEAASAISTHRGVRRAMVALQQGYARDVDLVMDGRDIGTRVLPQATYKFFLTADEKVRAQRRTDQYEREGKEAIFEDVLADLIERDRQDTQRAEDPLTLAKDAQMVDTTQLDEDAVVSYLASIVQGKNKLAKEKTGLYSFARVLAKIICGGLFGARARGVELFPRYENCIILGNHISAWDPITIAHFYKVSEVHFVAKESLFKIPVLPVLLRGLHAIRVNRGETDMGAMRASMQVLKDGHVLGIFPEGHRQQNNQVQGIETGVAVMALKSEVPLVPVLITGKYRLFGKIRMVVGAPIPIEDLRAKRADTETLEALKVRIIDAVEALRPLADF